MGSPAFNKPEYALGFPVEWFASFAVPRPLVEAAVLGDGQSQPSESNLGTERILSPDCAHLGLLVAYAP